MAIQAMVVELIIGIVFLSLYVVIDSIITNKRINENQALWDEYSKDMTFDEKVECFLDWNEQRKLEKGWKYCYFPKMHFK